MSRNSMPKKMRIINTLLISSLAVISLSTIAEETASEEAGQKTGEQAETASKAQQISNSSGNNASNNSATGEADTVRLQSVFVGDKEQPAISYFIPWQGIGTPDKLYWNVEQKHDNALDLVDRDIMLRSMHFYNEMNLEAVEFNE